MSRNIEIFNEKIAALSAVDGYNGRECRDRIEILRDATLTLLDEVEALTSTRPINIRYGIKLDEVVQRFERDLIQQALERTGGHQTRAARLLGINLTTLHYKIKRYQLRIPDVEETQPLSEAC